MSRGRKRSAMSAVVLSIAAGGTLSCADGEERNTSARAPKDAVPAQIGLSGGTVTVGVKLGKSRHTTEVQSFRIAVTPTTVAQYARCVEGGNCSAPGDSSPKCAERAAGAAGFTFDVEGAADAPVTCVTPKQAKQFCSWVGGSLPTVAQWLLAARGPNVTRFSWGNEPVTCERHWTVSWTNPRSCCRDNCNPILGAITGTKAGTGEPGRMQDTLVAPGEFVKPEADQRVLGCAPQHDVCLISGRVPGAIDEVRSFEAESAPGPATFRCSWSAE